MEFRRNRAYAKRQNEEIEGVQRPPEETGDERVALRSSEPPKMS